MRIFKLSRRAITCSRILPILCLCLVLAPLPGCSGPVSPEAKLLGAWKMTASVAYKGHEPVGEGRRTEMKRAVVYEFLPGGGFVALSEDSQSENEKAPLSCQVGTWDLSQESGILKVWSKTLNGTPGPQIASSHRFLEGGDLGLFSDGSETLLSPVPTALSTELTGAWLEAGQTQENWKRAEVFTYSGLNIVFKTNRQDIFYEVSQCTEIDGRLKQTKILSQKSLERTFEVSGNELKLIENGKTTSYTRLLETGAFFRTIVDL